MCSVRRFSYAALCGLIALWSGCGGVSEPGPLDRDGEGAAAGGFGDASGGSRTDDDDGSSAGGAPSNVSGGGRSGSEGVDPELGLDGAGGAGGAAGGAGGGASDATGGSSQNGGGAGADTAAGGGGGSPATAGAGGDDPESGGTGGDDLGSGGSEQGGSGGQDGSGAQGGEDPGTGGTNGDTEQGGSGGQGGEAPAAGGTGGEDPGTGGTNGDVEQGGSGGQGGSEEPPPDVDVDIGDCESFEPCGGDVEGVWTYTAACIDLADLGIAEDDLQAMCAGAELTLAGQVSGTLTFADNVVTRRGRSSAQGQVFVPAFCALPLGSCAGVEQRLAGAGITGARCLPQGNLLPDCRCTFTLEAPALQDVPYVADGDVLLLADGRELQYCVDGDNLTYVEIGSAAEPGVRELERR